MGSKSKIEWTDATWNPIRGCSRVSEGCRHCYAEAIAARFSGPGQPYEGIASTNGQGQPRWTGEVRLVRKHLSDPIRWKKPRRIFVNSMSDLFHEKVTFEQMDAIFAVMALNPQHTFQILTKRPQRMVKYLGWTDGDIVTADRIGGVLHDAYRADPYKIIRRWPMRNVWLGVSVEDQATAAQRIPLLLEAPAEIRWISYEPALGPIMLGNEWLMGRRHHACQAGHCIAAAGRLDWVVVGGESGPGARPAHPDWFRAVRDQCQAAGVPFFFKQWGEWAPSRGKCLYKGPIPEYRAANEIGLVRLGKKAAGRLLDGREWNEFPGADRT